MPVPFVTLTNDLALEDFQRGKERGRAVAFVVVSHSAATPFFERQARLRSIQKPESGSSHPHRAPGLAAEDSNTVRPRRLTSPESERPATI